MLIEHTHVFLPNGACSSQNFYLWVDIRITIRKKYAQAYLLTQI